MNNLQRKLQATTPAIRAYVRAQDGAAIRTLIRAQNESVKQRESIIAKEGKQS